MDNTTTNNKEKVFTKANFFKICFPHLAIMKRVSHKAKEANMRPSFNIWFFSFFSVLTFFVFFGSAGAAEIASHLVAANQDSVFANIVAFINPDVLDNPKLNPTFTNKDVGIYLAMIGVFANKAALTLFFVSFVWFSFKSAIDYKMGVTNKSTISKAAICFFFFLCLLPRATFSAEVHGTIAEKAMYQHYLDKVIYETVAVAEDKATTNMNKPISIPSYKVVSPKNLRNDFLKIINVYLLGYENTTKRNETISIEYIDGLYRIEFEMGGTRTIITTKSGVALNNQGDLISSDIELLEKEKLFVKSYIEYMFNTAIKLGQKLEKIDFSYLNEQSGNFQDYENVKGMRLSFVDDYNTYCDHIDEYSLAGSDKKAVQRYFEVVSLCAAQEFLIENYQNDFYKIEDVYKKTSILRNNHTLMFGANNPTANYDQVVEFTKRACKGGYIACAEAVQFTSIHNVEGNKRLGVLALPVGIINQLAGSIYDASDKVLKVKEFKQEASRTIQFRDMVSDERALFNIPITLHTTNNTGLVADVFDLYDFNNMGLPAMEDIMGSIIGGDITLPFERVKSCFYNTDQVFNGFKCNSATKEMLDLGTGLTKMGLAIYVSNNVVSAIPTRSKLKDGVAVGKKIGGSLTTGAGVAASVILPALFTNPTKDDPYYSQNTVQGLVLLSFIISFFNAAFSAALGTFATLLIGCGVGIIVLIYGFYFHIFLLFVSTLIELIIDSKMLMIKLYSAVIDNGVHGIGAVFTEIVAELVFLIFLVFMMNDMTYIMNILLLSQFEAIFAITDSMKGSIESVLIGLPQLFLAIVIEVIKLILVGGFITSLLQRILAQVKQS